MVPAIEGQHLADVGLAAWTRQERDRCRDLMGLKEPADRDRRPLSLDDPRQR